MPGVFYSSGVKLTLKVGLVPMETTFLDSLVQFLIVFIIVILKEIVKINI